MGKGAPKRVEQIPISTVVHILASQALVMEAEQNLAEAVKEVLDGSEDPYHWAQMDKWRELLVNRNRLYTGALLRLSKTQDS
jgi:hypothetical protein